MRALPYRIYDADNRSYEPDDCFTRHVENRWRDRTVRIERSGPGPGTMFVGDERCHFFSVGADRVRNGSDYPHPESPIWPAEFAMECAGLADAAVRRIMRDDLAGLVS